MPTCKKNLSAQQLGGELSTSSSASGGLSAHGHASLFIDAAGFDATLPRHRFKNILLCIIISYSNKWSSDFPDKLRVYELYPIKQLSKQGIYCPYKKIML